MSEQQEEGRKTLMEIQGSGRAQGGSKLADMPLAPGAHRLLATDGAVRYGTLIEAMLPGAFDVTRAEEAIAGIKARAARVRAGDLSGIEEDLCAQVAWLGALIAYCVERGTARGAHQDEAGGAWLALALKAAATQARTSATLAGIVLAGGRAVNE